MSGDPRPWVGGWRGATIAALCAVPLVVGFALPVALLVRLVHAEPEIALTIRFVEWAWNSLRVAGIASAIAVVFAVLVVYATRLAPGPVPRMAARVLALGYAVPGTVLAVGVLLPLGAIDAAIADAIRRTTGTSPGLVLTGTTVALIYATRSVTSRSRGTDRAASRGSRPRWTRRPAASDAGPRRRSAACTPRCWHAAPRPLLLVFVDVMKELPATLVLRPFNFDTLATQAYSFARVERLAEAAVPSLAIVAVGLIPIIALARASRRRMGPGLGVASVSTDGVNRGRTP
jgi:iron(III) transport system permease protein